MAIPGSQRGCLVGYFYAGPAATCALTDVAAQRQCVDDDVFTAGAQLHQAAEALRERGAIVQGGAKTWGRVRRGGQGIAMAATVCLQCNAGSASGIKHASSASQVGLPGRSGSCVPPGRLQSP